MIVKDEEEVLERCLTSFIGDSTLFDEVVIVDTGSTDRTVEIAKSFGCKVYHFEWVRDFSVARNFAMSKVTTDYCMWCDADDVLLPTEFAKLKALKPNLTLDMYLMTYDYFQDQNGRSLSLLERERIHKNDSRFRFRYPIHEVIPMDSIPNLTWDKTGITITHKRTGAGYSADLNRNISMLEEALEKAEYKDDPRLRYYLAKECHDVGLLKRAIDELKRYLDMDQGFWEDRICAQFRLAQCQQAQAQYESDEGIRATLRSEARHNALRAIEIDDRWAEPYYVLGLLAWDHNNWHSAIRWFEICRQMPLPDVLSPLRPDFYQWLPNLQLCVMYDKIGNYELALERNREAARYRPNDSRMVHNETYLKGILNQKKIPNQPLKLNLGSGGKRYKDYINCDLFNADGVDEVFSLHDIPYADSTIQAIHSEHALEHLPQVEALAALREWHRVLIPGGEVHLQMPDLRSCCHKYIEAVEKGDKRLQDWYKWTIYGRQVTEGEIDRGQFHQTGFTLPEIKRELEDAGFVIDYGFNYDGYDTPSLEVRALKARGEVKIGWLGLNTSLDVPQYRIRTFHIDRYLRSRGYRSQIINCDTMLDYDILVFGRSAQDLQCMKLARKAGKRIIYDLCESLFQFNNPSYKEAIEYADIVVCCSNQLAEEVQANTSQQNVIVIEDAVESDFNVNCPYDLKKEVTVGWIGMGGNARHADRLRPMIESLGYRLITIHEHENADVKWGLDTWQQQLSTCDIAIAPVDAEAQPAKSSNKILTYMGFGIPVVASPLPAYEEVIEHGVNGYIATTDEEWERCLKALRYAEERKRIGTQGKETARQYSLDIIGHRWADILIDQGVDRTVDIIVTTYGGGKYLDACLKSIEANTNHPHNVIVVDAKERETNFSQTINQGIRQGNAPYVCFLNDDVIVTKGWLTPLVEQIKDNVGFCNPLSNCDKFWLHQYEMNVNGVDLGPGTTTMNDEGQICLKTESEPTVSPESLYSYYPPTSQRRIYQRDWVAFFATVMSRELINKVGLLDEDFRTGSEDLDYSTRASKFGYTCAVNENSFVFHFGGVSRKAHEDENYAKHQEEDKYNNDRVRFKYDRPLIVIQTGWAYNEWDANTLRERGLGGSETWAIRMAEEMAKLGPRVVVFAQTGKDKQIISGVEWYDQKDYQQFIDMNWIDVFIVSRYTQFLRNTPVRAGKKYLMLHDIFAIPGHGEGREWVREVYDNLDGVFVLSPWHKQFAAQWHGVPEDKFIITGNGIDLSRFEEQDGTRKKVRHGTH